MCKKLQPFKVDDSISPKVPLCPFWCIHHGPSWHLCNH